MESVDNNQNNFENKNSIEYSNYNTENVKTVQDDVVKNNTIEDDDLLEYDLVEDIDTVKDETDHDLKESCEEEKDSDLESEAEYTEFIEFKPDDIEIERAFFGFVIIFWVFFFCIPAFLLGEHNNNYKNEL